MRFVSYVDTALIIEIFKYKAFLNFSPYSYDPILHTMYKNYREQILFCYTHCLVFNANFTQHVFIF